MDRAAAAGLPASPSGGESPPFGLEQPPLRVAIIGAGYLGARIAAELLILGSDVSVYDRDLARFGATAQAMLNGRLNSIISECEHTGLLTLAGMTNPSGNEPWKPFEGEPPRRALCCNSVSEASKDADIVLEAVPDHLEIKRDVFVEAVATARPGVLLATNTLSLPLAKLQSVVDEALRKSGQQRQGARVPRVVGLRFLAPVVFVPLVEVTLTPGQAGQDRVDLLNLLLRWRKSAFHCDVQGAAGHRRDPGADEFMDFRSLHRCSKMRLLLDPKTAGRRQIAEAKLRKAHRAGPAAMAALSPEEVFGFIEEICVVCYQDDSPPTVKSAICGHRALCPQCAHLVAQQPRPTCPICRARFVAEAQ
mmetsp:Transcript_69211/g.179914  ORF Transcript_69211/g.179914 Transcript_69211/m.179914 type:complete len:363 (+) Transcript_69211:111-1199(+)